MYRTLYEETSEPKKIATLLIEEYIQFSQDTIFIKYLFDLLAPEMSGCCRDGGIAGLEEEFSATTARNGTIATLIIMYCACCGPDWATGINP
jgi:hypothetical protein